MLFGTRGSGNEFVVFQERLGLAEEAQRRGWRPRLLANTQHPTPNTQHPTPTAATASDDQWERAAAAAKAAREQIT